ncbi:MAG: hypothetical protein M0Z53_06130 [Thermaerobacter sp.]|nr:hypothetical protein [Thermaerobacter sp.]
MNANRQVDPQRVARMIAIWALTVFFGVAIFLLWERWTGANTEGCPLSSVSPLINCQRVLTSAGSRIFFVPLVLWGALWAAGGVALAFDHSSKPGLARLWTAVGIFGLLWAIGHEVLLATLCAWCTLLQALAVLAMWMHYRMRAKT